jgi:DNA-binding transcriptional ArsR family regulator
MDNTKKMLETEEIPILPENVPVAMPELPAKVPINTMEQMKAIADPTRNRLLGIIQQQPATAKQIAEKLKMAPGTINHHLQVLEAAGLAKVVARRLIHGIVAKYYTRTARIFEYSFSPEVAGHESIELQMLTSARDEYAESLAAGEDYLSSIKGTAHPRARISTERAQHFKERFNTLIDEFIREPYDPNGEVYTLFAAFFKAPPYLQTVQEPSSIEASLQGEAENKS